MSDNSGVFNLTWSAVVSSVDTDGDMSQSSIYSNSFDMRTRKNASVRLAWGATGTPVGTISFEVSNNGSTWEALDSTLFSPALTHPAGSASSCPVEIRSCSWKYLRAKYTKTSGSGTLTGTAFIKD